LKILEEVKRIEKNSEIFSNIALILQDIESKLKRNHISSKVEPSSKYEEKNIGEILEMENPA